MRLLLGTKHFSGALFMEVQLGQTPEKGSAFEILHYKLRFGTMQ
jgi:hypothetical protein